VVLFFMSIWGLPLITALVAGDIVAAESHNDTLKTILTRSRDRGQVFAGKVLAVLTYTFVVVFAMGLVGLVAGTIAWGFHPLTSLSGTKVSPGHGFGLLVASLAVYFLPLAGIAAFGLMLSTVTRNSAASVVGSLMFALLRMKRCRDGGQAVAVATVVATRRSAPRPLGSKLAVSETGELAGSVAGGCVESDVAVHAREVLESGLPKLLSYGIPDEDAWEVGLPCGGEIDVFVERVEGELPDPEQPQVIFTVVDGDRAGERWVSDDGEVTRTQLVEREGERVFAEVLGPPPRLLVFGAVDLAEELCRAAKGLGWRTVVADARARFATAERVPSAEELRVGWPDDVFAEYPPDARTAVVVLTHEERFD